MSVGIVVVSHSQKIAEGVVELAGQMAASVSFAAAGGTDDGSIGTSFERIQAGVEAVQSGDGVVLICDLGSAVMTAETVVEFLDDAARAVVRIADAPIVEGAVAAAVAAESGANLDEVVAAAETAGRAYGAGGAAEGQSEAQETVAADDGVRSVSVQLTNAAGLHARPAAEFVKLASSFDASVQVNGTNAKSLLGIMALGLHQGATATITAEGPDADAALAALTELVESGFGEA